MTNENLIELINSQINNNNRTLNLISQSYNILSLQQQNIYSMIRLLNTSESYNDNRTINPINIIISDISFSDNSNALSGVNILDLFNILTDNSNNIETERTLDISNVTILKKFNEITDCSSNQCSITLETFNENDDILIIKKCNHYFKCDALKQWLSTNNICPICRRSID